MNIFVENKENDFYFVFFGITLTKNIDTEINNKKIFIESPCCKYGQLFVLCFVLQYTQKIKYSHKIIQK